MESERIFAQMKEILSAVDETEQPLAFRERAAADMVGRDQVAVDRQQWRYFMASTFCDLWAEIRDASGHVVGAFLQFFRLRALDQQDRLVRHRDCIQDLGSSQGRPIGIRAALLL